MEKDLYRGRREDPRKGSRAPDKTGKVITPGKIASSAAGLLNKAFKEAKEKQEYDYEGDMAMSQLKSIIANATRIHDMLGRDTNIPEWVQSKITLAEDYISTAANYMQGEMKEETGTGTGPVNVAANVADPKNKRLFGQPAKRKMPSFKSFTEK